MNNKILEIEDLKRILPQRYPFLMIDRVIESSAEKVVAIKNVSINEEYFKGHFPGEPVMPGALIIESMAQTAIVLYREKFKNDKLLYLGKVKAKFIKPVKPGDQLILEATPKKMLEKMGFIDVVATVNKEKVAEMEMGYGVSG
jgi:3-hydroxyacyl-[acyl-carrier-protein] dehydratase